MTAPLEREREAIRGRRLKEYIPGGWTSPVALAFKRSEDDGGDVVACGPKETRSVEQAIRMAESIATQEGHCGAIALSRSGQPAFGDGEDATILKAIGEVDVWQLSA